MNIIITELKALAALNLIVPPAADRTYKLGEQFLIYNENKKQWKGPYIVVDFTGRNVTEANTEKTFRQMISTYQEKLYFSEYYDNLHSLKSSGNLEKDIYYIILTKVIEPHDPRAWKFDGAKRREIKGLIRRGKWKVVCRDEVPYNDNILLGRFILAIKDEGSGRQVWRARFFVQVH